MSTSIRPAATTLLQTHVQVGRVACFETNLRLSWNIPTAIGPQRVLAEAFYHTFRKNCRSKDPGDPVVGMISFSPTPTSQVCYKDVSHESGRGIPSHLIVFLGVRIGYAYGQLQHRMDLIKHESFVAWVGSTNSGHAPCVYARVGLLFKQAYSFLHGDDVSDTLRHSSILLIRETGLASSSDRSCILAQRSGGRRHSPVVNTM